MSTPTQSAKTIGEMVRKAEKDYISGETTISEYVQFSQYDNVNRIDAYLNSKHTSGLTDSQGREKPFFNIVTGAVNIWYRATDIDRKNVRIKATKAKDVMGAYLASVHLQQWMKMDNFGVFLNDWGRTLARYGSAVTKFVEKDGKLHASIVPWNRLITDTIDFEQNIKIEVLELTEAQLKKNKSYNAEMVEALCYSAATARTLNNNQRKDNKNDYFKVYEVHGEMPLATLLLAQGKEPKDSDYDTYVQQMHVISFTADVPNKGDYSDFTLYSGTRGERPVHDYTPHQGGWARNEYRSRRAPIRGTVDAEPQRKGNQGPARPSLKAHIPNERRELRGTERAPFHRDRRHPRT